MSKHGNLANALRKGMQDKSYSLRTLADATGVSYEFTRRIILGEALPGKHTLPAFAKALELEVKRLEVLRIADAIRFKYKGIPKEITGRDPDLAPIERYWGRLTPEQKNTVAKLVETLANQNAVD